MCLTFVFASSIILPPDIKMGGLDEQGGGSSIQPLLPHYKLDKIIGIGSFGKVKIAEHVLTRHKVAIKILNRREIKDGKMEEKGLYYFLSINV
jgi:serine/threonine protein kinase